MYWSGEILQIILLWLAATCLTSAGMWLGLLMLTRLWNNIRHKP